MERKCARAAAMDDVPDWFDEKKPVRCEACWKAGKKIPRAEKRAPAAPAAPISDQGISDQDVEKIASRVATIILEALLARAK